jgi:hypothetical protein
MAHRYSLPIAVTRGADGMPTSFRWRGEEWHIAEIFETWHLMDKWWEYPAAYAHGTFSIHDGPQDRTY